MRSYHKAFEEPAAGAVAAGEEAAEAVVPEVAEDKPNEESMEIKNRKAFISASESLTIKALLVALVSSVAIILKGSMGLDFGVEEQSGLVDGILAVIDLIAIIVSFYGRMRAVKPIDSIVRRA
jgi:hypothetical protein